MVNTTHRPLYPGREIRYPLYRMLGRPQGSAGHQEQGTGSECGDRGRVTLRLGDRNTVRLYITNQLSVLFLSFILS